MASLVGVSWVQPSGRIGGKVVEGRDEDPFTLLVEAGERLFGALQPPGGRPDPLPKLLLLAGDAPEGEVGQLFEAWGIPPIPVETHPPGELGAYQAIARALENKVPSTEPLAVLVAQVAGALPEGPGASPRRSAGAVGLRFGPGPGLRLVSKTGAQLALGESEARRKALAAALKRGGPDWSGPWDALATSGEEGRAAWEDLGTTLPSPDPLPAAETSPAGEEGEDSALGPARALALLAHRTPAGANGMWVHARGHFVALRSFQAEVPLPLEGLPPERGGGSEVPREAFRGRRELEATLGVSQGAYVSASRYRETIPTRWRLEGDHCGACGHWTLPPRDGCASCGRVDQLTQGRLPRVGGLLEATTVIRPGAQPAELDTLGTGSPGGYVVGLVRLAPGVRWPVQVTDVEPPVPCPGRRVETVLRRIYYQDGSWRYGLKGRLLPGEPEPLEHPPRRGQSTINPPSRARQGVPAAEKRATASRSTGAKTRGPRPRGKEGRRPGR